MRWEHLDAKHGDFRTQRRFAIIPTKLKDGYTVWLEEYELVQICISTVYGLVWSFYTSRVVDD